MSASFRNVLLVSAFLKILLALAFADLTPRYDEVEFLQFGEAIYENGLAPVAWRAPGYQWFVALGLGVSGGKVVGVRLLQVLISILASWLVYRVGRRWGERVGFVAGTFVAFYPSHVAFSHLLWSETLYGFLVLLGFERALAARDSSNAWRCALFAGIAFGAATLTRSVGLALAVVTAAWLLVDRKTIPTLALVAGLCVVVIPWSVFSSQRAGRLVVVDSNAGFNVWSGNNEYIPTDTQGIWSVGLPLANGTEARFQRFLPDDEWRREVPTRMRRDGVVDPLGPDGELWYRDQAGREIRAEPWQALGRVPKKIAAFWAPDFFLPRHLLRDWYGEAPPGLALLLCAATWIACVVPLGLGPVAIVALPRGSFRTWLLLALLAYVAAHSLAYGHTRMHQPLVPFLVIAVAKLFFDEWRSVDFGRVRRAAIVGVLPVALWVLGSPQVAGLYLMPSPRHEFAARSLGLARHLPLPGSERPAWMLAGVLGSNDKQDEAREMLEASRHADHPWTLYLRSLLTKDLREATELLEQSLEVDPSREAPRWFLERLREANGS